MKHEAEQFHLFERDELFRPAALVPGTIVRLIWREPGRKAKAAAFSYRVLSPTLYYLLSGRDPALSSDWEREQEKTHVALLAVEMVGREFGDSGDFLPANILFWRKREAVTAGY